MMPDQEAARLAELATQTGAMDGTALVWLGVAAVLAFVLGFLWLEGHE